MINLFKILLKSTAKYVGDRIENKTNRLYYDNTIAHILDMTEDNQFNQLTYHTIKYKNSLAKKYYPYMFTCNPKKYEMLAAEHAVDIIESFIQRFGGFNGQ